ncbi:hypothetical protein [Kordiimonas sp. SCSIO 12610]|uniref:hypothetical protein n=1 Tax=Kordiimonas sp. SCSIO 12610 TaxID=2829597 RepID=UPI00210BC98C|nr:hypothetical protein [Kordiimonas sp. SCSIO 12610]UTW56042.1 hypothetical protein KFF44_03875 [Kordiimonas sp. SCSIO 12610]
MKMYPSSLNTIKKKVITCLVAGAIGLLIPSSFAYGDEDVLRVYTHGETSVGYKNADGTITGEAVDKLSCAMGKLNQDYHLSIAPLSRARSITDSDKPSIWFPSSFEGDRARLEHLAGPAGNLVFNWHMRKDSDLDPKSEDFHKNATVTTFSGSRMIGWLKENNYNYIVGSADPNRLVYMLLSKQVDAILSVQLGESASPSVKKQIKEGIKHITHSEFQTAFHFSDGMLKSRPEFVKQFREALQTCS